MPPQQRLFRIPDLQKVTEIGSSTNQAVLFNNVVGFSDDTTTKASIQWSTPQTVDCTVIGVDTTSHNLIICDEADKATDWGLATSAGPTLAIQSSDATSPTERLRAYHNGTDFYLTVDSGELVIDGASNFRVKDLTYHDSGVHLGQNCDLGLGAGASDNTSLFRHSNAQTIDCLLLGLDATSWNFVICGVAHRDTDHQLAASTDPTLYIKSRTLPASATDEWISVTHDVTDGIITTGSGNIVLNPFVSVDLRTDNGPVIIGDGTYAWNHTPTGIGCEGSIEIDGTADFDGLVRIGSPTTPDANYILHGETTIDGGGIRLTNTGGKTNLVFQRDTAVPADGDIIGSVIFNSDDSGGTESEFGVILTEIQDPAAGTEEAIMRFKVADDGGAAEYLRLDATNAIKRLVFSKDQEQGNCKHKFDIQTVADEGSFSLPTGTGWCHFVVGDNEEYGWFSFTADAATRTTITVSGNVVTTDTDEKLCLLDGGVAVSIKNRLGAEKKIGYEVYYFDAS